jgi:hypothetical protein
MEISKLRSVILIKTSFRMTLSHIHTYIYHTWQHLNQIRDPPCHAFFLASLLKARNCVVSDRQKKKHDKDIPSYERSKATNDILRKKLYNSILSQCVEKSYLYAIHCMWKASLHV